MFPASGQINPFRESTSRSTHSQARRSASTRQHSYLPHPIDGMPGRAPPNDGSPLRVVPTPSVRKPLPVRRFESSLGSMFLAENPRPQKRYPETWQAFPMVRTTRPPKLWSKVQLISRQRPLFIPAARAMIDRVFCPAGCASSAVMIIIL